MHQNLPQFEIYCPFPNVYTALLGTHEYLWRASIYNSSVYKKQEEEKKKKKKKKEEEQQQQQQQQQLQ